MGRVGQGTEAKRLGQCSFVGRFKCHIQGVALFISVFNFKFGQRRAAIEAPVNWLEAAVDKTTFNDAFESTNFAGFIGKVHGAIGSIPITQHAQAFEVFALLVNLFGGKGAALGLHVVATQLAAMQFFNGVFNGQTVAVPAGYVLRVKARQLLGLDDHVFEHFVQGVTNVQFAIGIRRAIVQHKQGGALACKTQFFVQALVAPSFGPGRLTLG